MRALKFSTWLAAMPLVLVTACGTEGGWPTASSASSSTASAPLASGYGVVQSVDVVSSQNSGLGLGTVAGAAVGGILGNQIGEGRGNTAATIAGAAGGGYVGHRMEQNSRRDDQAYRVTIRMDDGSLQTMTQKDPPNVRPGDRVRIAGGAMQRY